MSVKRQCLMMSDLQSGATEVEYVLAADYDAEIRRHEILNAELIDKEIELVCAIKGLLTFRDEKVKWEKLSDGEIKSALDTAFNVARGALLGTVYLPADVLQSCAQTADPKP